MNREDFRNLINQQINGETDANRVAQLELAREFFTNDAFRQALSDMVWEMNNPAKATR